MVYRFGLYGTFIREGAGETLLKKGGKKGYAGLFDDPSNQRAYAVGRTAAAFTVLVDRLLDKKGWTRADLARALGVDRSAITHKLSESVDMRLSSIVEILWELDVNAYEIFSKIE